MMREILADLVHAPAHATVRALRRWKLVAALVAVNLVLAVAFVAPLVGPLLARYSHSLLGRGHGAFDPVLLSDLSRLVEPRAGVLAGETFVGLVLGQLVAIFVSGGLVHALVEGKTSFAGFVGASARYLGRNLRVAMWAGLTLVPIMIVATLSGRLLENATEDATLLARFDGWRDLRVVTIVALIIAWRLLLSAARVILVTDDVGAGWRAYLRAVRLVFARPALVAAWALLGGIGLLALGLLATAHAHLSTASVCGALGSLVVAQGVVWTRMLFAVAETELVRATLRPTP